MERTGGVGGALILACPAAGRGAIHSRACERIPQNKKIKAPRAAAPAAACVAGRSTGQHMLPQSPSVQTTTTPKPSSFRNLRHQAAHPTGVAAALSRSDCTGGAALAKFQGNFFTPTPVVAPRSGLNPPKNSNKNSSCCRSIGQHMPPQPPAVKPNDAPHKIPKPLVPSLLRRHACLTTLVVKPPPPRNIPQDKRQQRPPSSFRNFPRQRAGTPWESKRCRGNLQVGRQNWCRISKP